MRNFRSLYIALIFAGFIALLMTACNNKDTYLEKRSGPWKITKVEISFYHNFSTSPDSVATFDSDTLGYFNFYHGTPASVYTLINYPSHFLIKDYDATYEVHEYDHEILVISNLVGSNWVDTHFTVTDSNKKKQSWLAVSDDLNGNLIYERIYVEKQ